MEAVESTAEYWQSLFENWPDAIAPQATIVTKSGESIPFTAFMVSGGLLLLNRNGPDAAGMRKVILGYEDISMIKLANTGDLSKFQCMGFQTAM